MDVHLFFGRNYGNLPLIINNLGLSNSNDYSTNVQIADLNALNAMLAIVKWKKLVGFYQDLTEEHHLTYTINTSQLRNEDTTA
jgi:hypothetical protein